MSGFLTKLEGTVRHCQSKEASVLWSHHEETRELPGERDNARNSARCTHSRKTTHGLDGQHQYVMRTGLSVEESIRMTEDTAKWRNYVGQALDWGRLTNRTVYVADECMRRYEKWQDGDAAFCHISLDTLTHQRNMLCSRHTLYSTVQHVCSIGRHVRQLSYPLQKPYSSDTKVSHWQNY